MNGLILFSTKKQKVCWHYPQNNFSDGKNMNSFYPTDLKDCRGIFFNHGVQMGGRAVWWAAGKSLFGLYLRNCKVHEVDTW